MSSVDRSEERPRGRSLPRPLTGLARLAIAGATAVSLAGFLAWSWPEAWRLDLLNHFRVQLAVGTGIAALVVGLERRWRWLLLALVTLGTNLALIVPLILGGPRPALAEGAPLRLLHLNVLSSNRAYAAVREHLETSGADLILVQEVSEAWAEELASLPGYRPLALLPRRDNFGLAVLAASSREVEAVREVDLGVGVPALEIELRLGKERLALLSVHTLPPASAEYAQRRDRMLAEAGAWAQRRRQEGALPVVIGDLNATPFSGAFRALVADGGLVDSELGYGPQASWPTEPWLFRLLFSIPIDHALHDPGLVTVERSVGPYLGSDHRPLRVDLALAEPRGGP